MSLHLLKKGDRIFILSDFAVEDKVARPRGERLSLSSHTIEFQLVLQLVLQHVRICKICDSYAFMIRFCHHFLSPLPQSFGSRLELRNILPFSN